MTALLWVFALQMFDSYIYFSDFNIFFLTKHASDNNEPYLCSSRGTFFCFKPLTTAYDLHQGWNYKRFKAVCLVCRGWALTLWKFGWSTTLRPCWKFHWAETVEYLCTENHLEKWKNGQHNWVQVYAFEMLVLATATAPFIIPGLEGGTRKFWVKWLICYQVADKCWYWLTDHFSSGIVEKM